MLLHCLLVILPGGTPRSLMEGVECPEAGGTLRVGLLVGQEVGVMCRWHGDLWRAVEVGLGTPSMPGVVEVEEDIVEDEKHSQRMFLIIKGCLPINRHPPVPQR